MTSTACKKCSITISTQTAAKNSGLCDNCFGAALRATAKQIGKKKK